MRNPEHPLRPPGMGPMVPGTPRTLTSSFLVRAEPGSAGRPALAGVRSQGAGAPWPFGATLASPPESGWQVIAYSTGVALKKDRRQSAEGPEVLSGRLRSLYSVLEATPALGGGGMSSTEAGGAALLEHCGQVIFGGNAATVSEMRAEAVQDRIGAWQDLLAEGPLRGEASELSQDFACDRCDDAVAGEAARLIHLILGGVRLRRNEHGIPGALRCETACPSVDAVRGVAPARRQ